MGYKENIQEFWTRHLKSFVKTYLTVFLTLYLRDIALEVKEGGDFMLGNMAVIIPAMKWSVIAVLRNVYKMLIED